MSDSFVPDPRHLADAQTSFASVDIRAALTTRPRRAPDYETEDYALAGLAIEMAERPGNLLQKLAETALALCHADTAGISLEETHDGVRLFRWEGLAGIFAGQRNNTMPRNASPCGVCVDENATQLMYLADRCFPALRSDPRFVEAMLIPFHYEGRPVGTVWIVMNQFDRHFDGEDERLLRTLAAFASAGWQHWRAAAELKEEIEQRKQVEGLLRRAQAQLMNLPAMLLRAQETERRLLARELHDDFSQKLVALGMQVSAFANSADYSPDTTDRRMRELSRDVGGLADEIQRLARQLHPAILDELGLEAALREECLSFSQRRGIPVRFETEDVPRSLPGDIALCMFRVAQECLRNIGKHAAARDVRVLLARRGSALALVVEDTGDGFDLEQARGKGRMGLIGMEERVRLVNGDFRIRSRPGVGTEIEVAVPLPAVPPPAVPLRAEAS